MPEVDLATLAIEVKNKTAQSSLTSFNHSLEQSSSLAGEVRKSLGIAFGAASVIAYMRRATYASMAFNRELYNVKSVGRELNLDKISKEILNLDSRLGSAADNAGALYFAYSAGVRGTERELVKFTGQIGKLSQSIVAGQIPTMDAVTSIMNAYNKKVSEAGEVTDFFQMVVRQGKTTGSSLANSIGAIAGVAANAGVSLDDLGASIATLTTTMPTERAITSLAGMLTAFIKPTDAAKKAAQQFGISLNAATLKSKGLAGVMKEIHEKVGTNTAAIAQIVPSIEGMRAAVALAGGQYKMFADNTVLFANKAGEATAAFGAQADNLDKQISSLPATFNKINIRIGESVKSFVTLGGALTPVIGAFNTMGETGQKLIANLALITGGFVLLKGAIATVNTVKAIKSALTAKATAAEVAQTAATTAGTAAITAQNAVITQQIALIKARTMAMQQNAYNFGSPAGLGDLADAQFAADFQRQRFRQHQHNRYLQYERQLSGFSMPPVPRLKSMGNALNNLPNVSQLQKLRANVGSLAQMPKIPRPRTWLTPVVNKFHALGAALTPLTLKLSAFGKSGFFAMPGAGFASRLGIYGMVATTAYGILRPLMDDWGAKWGNQEAGLKRGEEADRKTAELNRQIAAKREKKAKEIAQQQERDEDFAALRKARLEREYENASLFKKKGMLQIQLRSLYNKQFDNRNDPKKLLAIESEIFDKENKLADVKKQMANKRLERVEKIRKNEEEIFNLELKDMSGSERQNAIQSRFNTLRRRFGRAKNVDQMRKILTGAQSLQQMMQDATSVPQYAQGFQSASNAIMAGSNAAAMAESRSYLITPISEFSQKVDDNLKALKEMQNQIISELRKLVNKPQIAVN